MTVTTGGGDTAAGGIGDMADLATIPRLCTFVRVCLADGLTVRAALHHWRKLGNRVRTEDFAMIYRDEQRKRKRAA